MFLCIRTAFLVVNRSCMMAASYAELSFLISFVSQHVLLYWFCAVSKDKKRVVLPLWQQLRYFENFWHVDNEC